MTADQVKQLREATGAGVLECRKALLAANGDFERAKELVAAGASARAGKRAEREVKAGVITSYIHNDRIGVLVELNSETDFAARSEPFRKLANELAMQIAAMDSESVEGLLAEPYIRDSAMTVGDLVKNAIALTGENIKVTRFCRYAL
ncbi:MAG: translation elongation factor Ts [Candidatus Colwellbacteria bacterium]|nr:translation elongation factor Ts [Candidatus Colwellbacteria bacterium]